MFGTVIWIVCIVGVIVGIAMMVRSRLGYGEIGSTGSWWFQKPQGEPLDERRADREITTTDE